MRTWARYATCVTLGLAVGAGTAVQAIRGGLSSGAIRNGPWITGRDFGSTDASALTRARVALGGLLALPRAEAMYFNATTDSAGQPLEGRCLYTVTGVPFDAQWWSITAYNKKGYLIPNPGEQYSMGSTQPLWFNPSLNFDYTPRAVWGFFVGSRRPTDIIYFLPVQTEGPFELTLRVYHGGRTLLQHPERAVLPNIELAGCQ